MKRTEFRKHFPPHVHKEKRPYWYNIGVMKKVIRGFVAFCAAFLYMNPVISVSAANPCGSVNSEADRQACEAYRKQLSSQNASFAKQLSEIESQKKTIAANISAYRNQIADYQKQVDDLNAKIADLDKQITSKQAEIDDTQTKMDAKQADIDATQKSIDDISAKIKERMADGQSVMRINKYFDILMGARSFSDFLRIANGLGDITEYDNQTTNELVNLSDQLTKEKKDLENLKGQQETAKKDLQKAQDEAQDQEQQVAIAQAKVQVIEDAAEDQAAQLESQGDTVAANIESIKKTVASANSQLQAYQAKLDAQKAAEAEKQRQAANSGSSSGSSDKTPSGTSGWVNPVPGAHRSAGTWNYPGGGVHLGYDFAAARGTTIRAIGDGYVINSADGCNSGYLGSSCHGFGGSNGGGNQVYLITTLNGVLYAVKYLHMQYGSPIAAGTWVSAGQTIGKVGATGNVTGPHCHIEIFRIGTAAQFSSYVQNWNGDLAFGCGWAHGSLGTYGRRCDAGAGTPCRVRPENYF